MGEAIRFPSVVLIVVAVMACITQVPAPCNQGDIRLVGGTTPYRGRVEVCLFNMWGTVCDHSWSSVDARVACRQLGYSGSSAIAYSNAWFGQGSGPILLDNVACTGLENALVNCSFDNHTGDCYHSDDAGVRCYSTSTGCVHGDIRLAGTGTSSNRGRVEVCLNNQWGTVCDDSWSSSDARVTCRQLGYSDQSAIAYSNARYGRGTGSILLDNVACTGTESRLVDCSYDSHTADCSHSEDAAVYCSLSCTHGDSRLVAGSYANEGRVEVCRSGLWGTVCDDYWSSTDARVVCRQLGFSATGATAFSNAYFGRGTGSIFLDDVSCTGSELRLIDCTYDSSTLDCTHSEDAGARCQVRSTPSLTQNYLYYANRQRLVHVNRNGTGMRTFTLNTRNAIAVDYDIRLEMMFWSDVTSNTISSAHLNGTGLRVLVNSSIGVPDGLAWDWVNRKLYWTDADDNDIEVIDPVTNHRKLLISTGSTANPRAIVLDPQNRRMYWTDWGTPAKIERASMDGTSRQVLHSTSLTWPNALTLDYNTQTLYWMDGYLDKLESSNADGSSRRLLSTTQIYHPFDVTFYQNRLYWTDWQTNAIYSASVNLPTVVSVVMSGLVQDPMGIKVVSLERQPAATNPCASNNGGCSHLCLLSNTSGGRTCACPDDYGYQLAANGRDCIVCNNGDIRLAGSSIAGRGRVEICWNQVWGTVCDDLWSSIDATVACRQLGFTTTGAIAYSAAFYGQGTGPIYLDNVGCTGTESRLIDCSHRGIGVHDCSHSEDAGIQCQVTVCTYGDVRLVGGTQVNEGRVEVCKSGQWGTVCDDFWGSTDAGVVCRQLGYSRYSATAFTSAYFGRGTGSIWIDDARCTGSESRLIDCPHDTSTVDCGHSEDAGVRCSTTLRCQHGQLRLVGGTVTNEGRVEVCLNEVWGTVCDDLWSSVDANVACRNLGYSRFNAIAYTSAHFGQGTGPILLDDVACTGTEYNLTSCSYDSVTSDCGHYEDAGVRCSTTFYCNNGDLRLAGSLVPAQGRVELCYNETWGTICDELWSISDANVACRQLGYAASGSTPFYNAYFGRGTGPILLDDLLCSGFEARIIDCPRSFSQGIGTYDSCLAGHGDDAGVRCVQPCSTGSIRLVGGSTPNRGRVEVCLNNVWGTVCDDFWSIADANVACRQLGYSGTNATAYSGAYFGTGSGPIHLDDVRCTGSESALINCTYDPSTIDCSHFEDAGVQCQTCTNNDIRLVGGTAPTEGRVELCQNNNWGTVCDDLWDSLDATVVCRQLGYSSFGAQALSRAFFGQGTGSILLDNVSCRGSETRLIDCPSNPVGIHNCVHSEDAGVRCRNTLCIDGAIRLVGGSLPTEGRVEVCRSEAWGTVCDDAWTDVDASVACRQLGYSRFNASAYSNAYFGQGTGAILLDNVACVGNESRLVDCLYSPIHNCLHSEDAGASCKAELLCQNGDIRLVNGTTSFEGRVEICWNETWGTICDGLWSGFDAQVACRQLGYSTTGYTNYYNAYFGQGFGPILLDDLLCTGRETRIIDCPRSVSQGIGTYDFCRGHLDDAGLRCQESCPSGGIRLVGGTTDNEGRVEVCLSGRWGTVCDDSWSSIDARVACRQLGFSTTGAVAYTSAYFGRGTGPILLDDVACYGYESRLTSCRYDPFTYDCGHYEDAGVRCQGCTEGAVRLRSGTTTSEGRVEVCRSNAWGTVCDDFWGNTDANVVCKQLGFSRHNATAYLNAYFGRGSGTILLDDVRCSGTEDRLVDCSYDRNTLDCAHSEDAGVRCQITPFCRDGQLRLVGGTTASEGRVEICFNETWGTVCDDGWDDLDAAVVCRKLQYSRYNSTGLLSSSFGQGTGPIFLDNVACVGTENSLEDCTHDPSTTDCTHHEDAAVRCSLNVLCNNGDIRLVGGSNRYEGRVEICWNETWGTVCDGFWSNFDAQVACRQLGYSSSGAVAYHNAYFGRGTGPILLDDLLCTGSEARLVDCTHDGIGNYDFCSGLHYDDAGVRCQQACTEGSIRLSGYTIFSYQGRVEVCLNRQWGTVCDDYWSSVDANVACRQLGFSRYNAVAYSSASFGRGSGPIHLDDVACTGTEEALVNCSYDSYTGDCSHSEDAGVRCSRTFICNNGDVRLVARNGSTVNVSEGRVEICFSETWGTVSDDGWSTNDAGVVCRQLGFSRFNAQAFSRAYFGQGSGPIYLDNVACGTTENRLINCSFDMNTAEDTHAEDAGVRCSRTPRCNDGDIRLEGGALEEEGRVEVCMNEVWGTVCDDLFTTVDASVVCRQLGYSRYNAVAHINAYYGQGTGPILLDDVSCTGTEGRLVSCPYDSNTADCSHSEDAGVRCNNSYTCNNGDIRLVGGSNRYEGRVEVCWNETWGTVCDGFWSTNDGDVACRQLGFLDTGTVIYSNAYFGPGTGPILLDDLLCTGSEARLIDCPRYSSVGIGTYDGCRGHFDDAGVRCMQSCTDGGIRLVGGTQPNEGRVEVCLNSRWGTVCDDAWGTVDASVACSQLGYSGQNATAYSSARFGQGTGPIHLDNVACTGTEDALVHCAYVSDSSDCFHFEDAGVLCQACSDGSIRLVGGTGPNEGRVEVCLNGRWGTVCDDAWGNVDASVACRQLGYSGHNATAYSLARYGQGTGPIHLDNVACTGTEEALVSCAYVSHTSDCFHFEDAGVHCQVPQRTTFQVILLGVEPDCRTWINDRSATKMAALTQQIASGVTQMCSCGFTADFITNRTWTCDPGRPTVVIFEAEVAGTQNVASGVIAVDIVQWADRTNSINVGTGSALELEGGQVSTPGTTGAPSPAPGGVHYIWIIGIIGGVIVALILIAVIVVIAMCWRKSRAKYAGAPTRLTSDMGSYENPLYVEGPSPSYPASAPQHYDFDQAKPE